MSWQDARKDAEGLAGTAAPSSPREQVNVIEYLDPEDYRAAGGFRGWSFEYHRSVMQALARVYSRRGFKVMRDKRGTQSR